MKVSMYRSTLRQSLQSNFGGASFGVRVRCVCCVRRGRVTFSRGCSNHSVEFSMAGEIRRDCSATRATFVAGLPTEIASDVGGSSSSATGTNLRGAAISRYAEISHGKRRGILHSGEHHSIANRIELQSQLTNLAAIQPAGLGRPLVAG
jgi:hypothetical protein